MPLGAVKGNIGHTEGCSGLASVIKVCLAFENERLPPNINIKELKHELKEFCPPLYPNTEVIPYNPGKLILNFFFTYLANNLYKLKFVFEHSCE